MLLHQFTYLHGETWAIHQNIQVPVSKQVLLDERTLIPKRDPREREETITKLRIYEVTNRLTVVTTLPGKSIVHEGVTHATRRKETGCPILCMYLRKTKPSHYLRAEVGIKTTKPLQR
jgi:hypothetical protein